VTGRKTDDEGQKSEGINKPACWWARSYLKF